MALLYVISILYFHFQLFNPTHTGKHFVHTQHIGFRQIIFYVYWDLVMSILVLVSATHKFVLGDFG